LFYTRRVKTLELEGLPLQRVDIRIIRTWAATQHVHGLFPKLRTLRADALYVLPLSTALRFAESVPMHSLALKVYPNTTLNGNSLGPLSRACANLRILDFEGGMTHMAPSADVINLGRTLLRSSMQLTHVRMNVPISHREALHLAYCAGLIHADLKLQHTPLVTSFAQTKFEALQSLRLTIASSTSDFPRIFFGAEPTDQLRTLIFNSETMGTEQRLLEVIENISRWPALTVLYVRMGVPPMPSLEYARTLFQQLHSLPSLRMLEIDAQHLPIDAEICLNLLTTCIHLAWWHIGPRQITHPTDLATMSFLEFADILRGRPSAQLYPIRVRCDALPSLADLDGFMHAKYGGVLHVCELTDAEALVHLVHSTLPSVYGIVPHGTAVHRLAAMRQLGKVRHQLPKMSNVGNLGARTSSRNRNAMSAFMLELRHIDTLAQP
jgi:hypothetical protein